MSTLQLIFREALHRKLGSAGWLRLEHRDQNGPDTCGGTTGVLRVRLCLEEAQLDPRALRARAQSVPDGVSDALSEPLANFIGNRPHEFDIQNRHQPGGWTSLRREDEVLLDVRQHVLHVSEVLRIAAVVVAVLPALELALEVVVAGRTVAGA